VTTRRHIRIDVDLPELSPAQADFLWNFLDDLASDLWDAYEPELLEIENQRSRPSDSEPDWADPSSQIFAENPDKDDPDF
jgi:hypothetical protein